MSKGYHEVIVPLRIDRLCASTKYFDFAVAIFHWLIQELHVELKDQLVGVEIEVIKLVHHTPTNAYPALGIHYENPPETPDLEPLLEATINRLLQERSALELVTFIGANGIDWKAVTANLMENKVK